MTLGWILFALVACLAGVAVGYLVGERRSREQLIAMSARLAAAQENVAEQRQLLERAHEQLRQSFASVSAEALARNNEAFLSLARERFATLSAEASGTLEERKAQIEGLLKPMQQLLGTYQARLGEIEKSRVESYSMLREQLGSLAEIQRTLNTQTSELVTALRRPNARGQWGEITLRRLVELAGMANRCDFSEQTNVETDEGRQRPDMVVNLPGEAFLYAAVEHDPSLIEDALKNRVIIATPTTLIALLKAIEFGWRQEEVTQNAEEIRKHGKDLYDRIVTLMGHFNRLGSTLESAVTAYNATVGSLESRMLVTARRIAELGARSDKELPDPEHIDTRPRELTMFEDV